MKCKCSLNNNLKIIGFCDLEKFNEQIIQFREKSYSQLNLSEQIILPDNFPNIKSIVKTYISMKIVDTKIVDTPKSNSLNKEGFNLTGKMLLVYGSLEQIIIYLEENDSKTRHSLSKTSHFSTYIVIDDKVDKNQDNFYVYPYIENISLIPLGERTINKNISLFLFANNIKIKPVPPPPPPPPPPPEPMGKLQNAFILRTFDTDEEMVRIEFDKINSKLVVTSTGAVYNSGEEIVFSFILMNPSQTVVKNGSSIRGNENANDFKDVLNNASFEYGDLIELNFQNPSKVTLTNYPNTGNIYNMLSDYDQTFKITQKGIVPYVLPNDIILNAKDNNPVTIIQFDALTGAFLIKNTGNKANAGSDDYFKLSLYEEDGTTLKITASIKGESDAFDFKNEFFGQYFEFDDVIKLEYEEKKKVIITNFPNGKTPVYNPKDIEEYFQITKNGLITFEPIKINAEF